jgi:hypothetical protein
MKAQRPVRSAGRAFLLCNSRDRDMLRGSYRHHSVSFVVLFCLFLLATPLWGQDHEQVLIAVQHAINSDSGHHETVDHPTGWEGSAAGIAYSEFNHHLIGMLVLIIGLSEMRQALAMPYWAWTRFLLPGALLSSGFYLLVWSDHNAWPVGSLSFIQTFLSNDPEILQHKSYGILLVTVGIIELLRRFGQFGHSVWATPLPVFAIIGGLMLFTHSHGVHPSAQRIAMDHALMGTMAVTAGSSKLLSDWFRSPSYARASKGELLWACLILLIGIQLMIYFE